MCLTSNAFESCNLSDILLESCHSKPNIYEKNMLIFETAVCSATVKRLIMRNQKFLEFVCEHDSCAICWNFLSRIQTWSVKRLFLTVCLKGELQPHNKLISSKRPFKILQNETKIVKIRQAVLEIFNFKDLDLNSFPKKTTEKRKCCF